MLKSKILILLIAGLLLTSNIYSDDYEFLTKDEIERYLVKARLSTLVSDIQKLDILEHTIPVIPDPGYTATLMKNGDLLIFPINKIVTVTHGHLTYDITFRGYVVKDFGPKPPRTGLKIFFGIAGGLTTGILITTLIARGVK